MSDPMLTIAIQAVRGFTTLCEHTSRYSPAISKSIVLPYDDDFGAQAWLVIFSKHRFRRFPCR